MHFFKILKENEQGQALVVFALALVVIMGFAATALDVGRVALEKSEMQNIVDAAALAGAQELPSAINAQNIATSIAEANGAETSEIKITSPYKGDPNSLEIVCTRKIMYSFARVLGFTEIDLSVRAVAMKGASLPQVFTDYGIFSESATEPLSIGKNNNESNGAIHANNKVVINGNNNQFARVTANAGITVNLKKNNIGSLDEDVPIITIPEEFKQALLDQVTSAPQKYTGNQTFGGNGLDLNQSVYVQGNVTIKGNNLTGKGFIYATGDIKIDGNNTQIGTAAEPVFIYSEKDVIIAGNNNVMYCVIYAPNGTIDVQKNNWELHGRMIGKSFSEQCLKNNFEIIVGSDDFSGVPLGSKRIRLIE